MDLPKDSVLGSLGFLNTTHSYNDEDTKMVQLVNGTFVVRGSKGDMYKLDKNLSCTCKGYFAHGRCKHQLMVESFITRGATVDLARQQQRMEQK